jgi:hypothetical protein
MHNQISNLHLVYSTILTLNSKMFYLFNQASQLRTNTYLEWEPTSAKPEQCWANCALPYGTCNQGRLWYSLDLNQGVCSDTSCTEMQCLRPMRHSGALRPWLSSININTKCCSFEVSLRHFFRFCHGAERTFCHFITNFMQSYSFFHGVEIHFFSFKVNFPYNLTHFAKTNAMLMTSEWKRLITSMGDPWRSGLLGKLPVGIQPWLL